jgi:hypothetical protein
MKERNASMPSDRLSQDLPGSSPTVRDCSGTNPERWTGCCTQVELMIRSLPLAVLSLTSQAQSQTPAPETYPSH